MIQERIEQKKARILEYVDLIKTLRENCAERFDTDPVYRGALLHYLYLTADSCIALAILTIKLKALRPPQTYSEAFDILGTNRIIDPDFANSFAGIAGFRNFL
ncbi:MAG: type VII toxin-antitoxin system HepT family RNase toxin [Desulfosalsimonas sp.]